MTIIEILNWIAIIGGSVLIFLMLLSLLAGLDLDFDIGGDIATDTDTDADAGAGGIGVIKGALTFITVASWLIKIILATKTNPLIAIGSGIAAGYFALRLLNWFFRLLLSNEHNVNWRPEEAIGSEGKVYLRIPKNGSGIIHVLINGVLRELKAKSEGNEDIMSGAQVLVTDFDQGFSIVVEIEKPKNLTGGNLIKE